MLGCEPEYDREYFKAGAFDIFLRFSEVEVLHFVSAVVETHQRILTPLRKVNQVMFTQFVDTFL
jgi:hypothetical protein